MEKPTKAQIKKELATMNPTNIFRVAKKAGVDVRNISDVYNFVRKNAHAKKIKEKAFSLTYGAAIKKQVSCKPLRMPITEAIRFAKWQKSTLNENSNYFKTLILGSTNIYWARPAYGHEDYNKSIAFPITEKNIEIAKKINKYLTDSAALN